MSAVACAWVEKRQQRFCLTRSRVGPYLLALEHLPLVEHLHGENLLRRLVAHDLDLGTGGVGMVEPATVRGRRGNGSQPPWCPPQPPSWRPLSHEAHLAKGATADNLDGLKVFATEARGLDFFDDVLVLRS